MRNFIFALMPLLLCRCASMEKSVGLGVGIGAASGIAASQMANYNTKGHVVLGLGGAILGGVIAALLHKDHSETAMPIPLTNIMKGNQPPLADPEKDVILVPDKIEGDQFIENHRVWTIKKPARWQLHPSEQSQPSKEGETESGEENE